MNDSGWQGKHGWSSERQEANLDLLVGVRYPRAPAQYAWLPLPASVVRPRPRRGMQKQSQGIHFESRSGAIPWPHASATSRSSPAPGRVRGPCRNPTCSRRNGEYTCQFRGRLAMIQAVSQNPEHQGLNPRDCLRLRAPVGQSTGHPRRFGDPASIFLSLQFNPHAGIILCQQCPRNRNHPGIEISAPAQGRFSGAPDSVSGRMNSRFGLVGKTRLEF